MSGTPGGIVFSICRDSAGPLDLAERRMDDEKLFAGDDAREQDRHRLAVLASAAGNHHERPAPDKLLAFGRDGDVGLAAERREAAHALRSSWSVSLMAGVTDTKTG